MTIKSLLLAATCALGLGSAAQAATLTVDGGWSTFTFGGAGSAWSETYDFSLTGPAWLLVTDAYLPGDMFKLSVAGLQFVTSSVDSLGLSIGGDYTAAWISEDFSSFAVLLGAGSYTVTGSTTASPWGAGAGGISLSSTLPAVPLPASGLLLLAGLGGAGAMLRRKRAA